MKKVTCEICGKEDAWALGCFDITGFNPESYWKFIGACTNEQDYWIELRELKTLDDLGRLWRNLEDKHWFHWSSKLGFIQALKEWGLLNDKQAEPYIEQAMGSKKVFKMPMKGSVEA